MCHVMTSSRSNESASAAASFASVTSPGFDTWVDVTVPIRESMVHFPGDPAVELRFAKHLDRGDPATVSQLSFGVHTGTHVDAPAHFIAGASGVDALDIESMNGVARIIELHGCEEITAEDLEPYDLDRGERLLLRTDNSPRCWQTDQFVHDYCHLGMSAATYLAERGIRLVGIDYLSVGRGSEGPAVHRVLLNAGVVILEGLDLSQVEQGACEIVCLPLKIVGCDGAPARVLVRPDHASPSTTTRPKPERTAARNMRAVVVVPDERSVRLVEHATPRDPVGAEVLVRTLEVGICGTDREICAFTYGEPPAGDRELVIGHEALGEIVAVGPEVTWARAGELVVPVVRRPCGSSRCPTCHHGRPDYCVTGRATECGIVGKHGFLREYFLIQESYVVAVPRVFRDVGVLVEPLSVIAKGAEAYTAIRSRIGFDIARPHALVLGAGPVGLLGAMTLVAAGVETYVFSREDEQSQRAKLAREFGAIYVSAQTTPIEHLGEQIGSVDLIVEAVGVPAVAFGALPILAANGVYVLTGIPAQTGPMQADLSRWMRDIVLKNQNLIGTVNAGRSDYENALQRLEQFMSLFPDAVRSLIHRVPFEQAPSVLSRGHGLKDVIVVAT